MKKIVIGVIGVGLIYLSGCTTLKYTTPIVIKDGVSTGGETFELKKRFVLTKVTGFKVNRKLDGSLSASFDTVENADSKAVEALANFANTAMSMAISAAAKAQQINN